MPYRPLSSCDGTIQRLLITLPPIPDHLIESYYSEMESIFGEREMLIRYRNHEPSLTTLRRKPVPGRNKASLEEALHGIIESREVLTLFAEPNFHQDLVGGLVDALRQGIPIPNTEWAQDPFCVLTNNGCPSVFLQPLFSQRYADKFISLCLSAREELDMLVRPTTLLIEGGNMLAGDGFVFAGMDMLAQNVQRRLGQSGNGTVTRELVSEIEARFQHDFGCPVIWLGYEKVLRNWRRTQVATCQPDYHIDRFLTLGGRTKEGKHLVFVGDPQFACDLLERNLPGKSHQIPAVVCERFAGFDDFWDRYERRRGPGDPVFKVVKIPLYMHGDEVMSFNNGLVETLNGQRIAYLPNYETGPDQEDLEGHNPAIRILKQVTEEIFLKWGFDRVRWVGRGEYYRSLARRGGAMHCVHKVLARSD